MLNQILLKYFIWSFTVFFNFVWIVTKLKFQLTNFSMLSPLQKIQLKILKYGFLYLPTYPIQVEMETGEMKTLSGNSKKPSNGLKFFIFCNIFHGVLGLIFSWQYLESIRIGKINSWGILYSIFCGIELSITVLVLHIFNERSIIAGLRNLVCIKSMLYKGKKLKKTNGLIIMIN